MTHAAWRAANAVHLWALTWGRRRLPGSASDMVVKLASSSSRWTTNAGVVSSPVFTGEAYPRVQGRPRPPERPWRRRSTVDLYDHAVDG